jgi:hypothetical protein
LKRLIVTEERWTGIIGCGSVIPGSTCCEDAEAIVQKLDETVAAAQGEAVMVMTLFNA